MVDQNRFHTRVGILVASPVIAHPADVPASLALLRPTADNTRDTTQDTTNSGARNQDKMNESEAFTIP